MDTYSHLNVYLELYAYLVRLEYACTKVCLMSEGKDHVETIHLISSSSAVFAFPAQAFSSLFNHSKL